jgi:hypothetical protein
MRLHREWRKIVRHAWSVRLLFLAGLLQGLEAIMPLLPSFLSIPTPAFAVATAVVIALAFVAKLIAQKEFEEDKDADQ